MRKTRKRKCCATRRTFLRAEVWLPFLPIRFTGWLPTRLILPRSDEIYKMKGRPETRALPILVRSLEQAMQLAREVPQNFLRLAQEFWPGALTLVVDAANRLPLKVTANTGKVALRWPKSDVARRLIEEFDGPITGTSANISGFPSCSSAEQVMKQLGGRLPLILDSGETGAMLGSTIVDVHGGAWKIIREGAIPVADIQKALK